MRCFLAIELPEHVKDQIEEFKKWVRGRVKFVEKKNLHLTLRFLGDVDPNQVMKALEDVEFKPFTAKLEGIGFFPNERFIRVIWIGVGKGSEEIEKLHEEIERRLGRDERFVPHVTIARAKGRVEVLKREFSSDEFEVSSFSLFRSTLTPKGPIYEVIASFPTRS
ncbi:RNA 2',3'-cyclic phosphodiesterase [Nanoarchaeota archaeon]|nr:MAG: RNA 2',3'-cyclic phosphodiesterase [Nanoarchaeota archaeon]